MGHPVPGASGSAIGDLTITPLESQPGHVVSASANHVNFCLGRISVDDKSNEISAVKELQEILNLQGAVVTADAMHCQQLAGDIQCDAIVGPTGPGQCQHFTSKIRFKFRSAGVPCSLLR